MRTALSIAGSDSCGGAGIQADIKTMTVHGVYAMTAVTALTAQNTTGVRGILESTPDFLAQQIDAVFEDIVPDAVKVGMVASAPLIHVIAERLAFYRAKNLVVDPVMVATSGAALLADGAVRTLVEELLPLADLITPNLAEGEILAGRPIRSAGDMEEAARAIADRCGCAVLLKGGHGLDNADDLLWTEGRAVWFPGKRIDNPNTHGTGCTLSSAIAANLAKGEPLDRAVGKAKDYLTFQLILKDTGETLFQTGLIPPGMYCNKVELSRELTPGAYAGTMHAQPYTITDPPKPTNNADFDIQIHVL